MTKTVKTAKKNLAAGRGGWLCLLVVMAGLSVSAGVRANAITLEFKYTVVQGTCDVNVVDEAGAAQLSAIDMGSISVPALNKAWVYFNNTKFNVQLSNCAGIADSSKTPALTVTGTHDASGVTSSAGDKSYVFRDSGGSARGFGFALHKNATGLDADTVGDINSGYGTRYFPIPSHGKGSALNGGVFLVPISVSVTCGSLCKDAASVKLAGTLDATVTFNFLYY